VDRTHEKSGMITIPKITGARFHWESKDKSCGILTVSDTNGKDHKFRSYSLTVEKLKQIEDLVGSVMDAVKIHEVIEGLSE